MTGILPDELAAVPKAGRDRLAAEQARLEGLQAAAEVAKRATETARQRLVDDRVEGRDGGTVAYDRARAAEAEANDARDVQASVVQALGERLAESVRAERADAAQARLDAARQDYDEALKSMESVYDVLAAMRKALEDEQSAARDFAAARHLGLEGPFGFVASPGSRFTSIPSVAARVFVVVEEEGSGRLVPMTSRGELLPRLRRA